MLRILFSLMVVLTVATACNSEEARNLEWEELIPPGKQVDLMVEGLVEDLETPSGYGYDPAYFPMNEELNLQTVRIPGYMVPLALEETAVEEFMLVPYLGACIHVPPPPPNQIIYVKSPKRIEIDELFTPVWVVGQLTIESKDSELALAGYTLVADSVKTYEYKGKR